MVERPPMEGTPMRTLQLPVLLGMTGIAILNLYPYCWVHCRGRTILPGVQNPLASCQNFCHRVFQSRVVLIRQFT